MYSCVSQQREESGSDHALACLWVPLSTKISSAFMDYLSKDIVSAKIEHSCEEEGCWNPSLHPLVTTGPWNLDCPTFQSFRYSAAYVRRVKLDRGTVPHWRSFKSKMPAYETVECEIYFVLFKTFIRGLRVMVFHVCLSSIWACLSTKILKIINIYRLNNNN